MSLTSYTSFSTVDKILEKGGPLYVRNLARHSSSRAASILIINYPSSEGGRAFNCPRVNIPFDICDHVDPESLRASASFRKLVVNGTIEIVDPETAERELADPAKRTAFRAALKESDEHGIYQVRASEIAANKSAEQAIKAEKNQEQSAGMSHMLASMDPRLAAALSTKTADKITNIPGLDLGENPRFRSLESRSQGMAGESVVGELTLMYGDLTLNDLQSIVTGSAWPNEAKAWARERISYQVASLALPPPAETESGS